VKVAADVLSALQRGEKEPGAAVLVAISQEFGKSVDWLLTGKTHTEPKKRAARDSAELG
jgi:transcriptional regulator with XRE-family HTH domain